MLPDRWNPRVWLRDWLSKPTQAEIQAHQEWQARMYSLLDSVTGVSGTLCTGPDSAAPAQSPPDAPANFGRLH